jgi:glyoxylase-like metal-dependent hydrolase (beta-lactamase superfamily II)/rhodanese-related sulfurtransferase
MTRPIPEITPEELVLRLESGAALRVLDVRTPAAVAGSRIDLLPSERFVNIRGSDLLAMGGAVKSALPPDGPIAVVCGHGNSSKQVALVLNEMGYEAMSVRGGMAAWDVSVVPRELTPPAGFDRFVQFDRVAKGATGYLLASKGEALLVDPPRKSQPYLEYARQAGCRVVAVADTHAHADYISGGPALSRSLQIPYHLHPGDAVYPFDGRPAEIAFAPIEEGSTIRVGEGEVRVCHTPGHTEGSVTFLAGDAALTGDFIFVQSVGRPDLGGKSDEWTPVLWNSLERARREWNAGTRIYPAHYASASEREPDRSVGRPLGRILETNAPLRMKDREAFLSWVGSKVGNAPDNYKKIKAVNLGLLEVWDMEAQALEGGRNECALS